MRIISGKYRGRQFKSKAPNGVRPTADAVRETMFNVLNNLIDFDNFKVLDICAGTGALGIEAISRGADYCNFIEKNPRTARYIKNNLVDFQVPDAKYNITVADAVKSTQSIEETYNLIFFDPPYFEDLYDKIIGLIAERKILDSTGVFVIEYDEKIEFEMPEVFHEISTKKIGSTILSFWE